MIDTDPSIQATLLVELESTPEAVMEQLVAIADNTGNEIPYAVTAFAADPHREVVAFLEAVEGEFTLVTAADVATALDRALAAAASPYLILISHRVRPAPGWLAQPHLAHCAEPHDAVLSPRLLRPDGLIEHDGLFVDTAGKITRAGHGQTTESWPVVAPTRIAAVGSDCFFFTARIAAESGFSAADVADDRAAIRFCARLFAIGRECLSVPAALVIRRTAVDTAASRAGGLAGLRPEYLDSSARMRAAQEEAVLARLAADDRLGLAHDFQPEPYLAFVRSFFAN